MKKPYSLRLVKLNADGYTTSGRYFGIGAPLYCLKFDTETESFEEYTRAWNSEGAVLEFKKAVPRFAELLDRPGASAETPSPKNPKKVKVSERRYTHLCNNDSGYCPACGILEGAGFEPDARGYECPKCGERIAMGFEEALLMEHVEVA